MKCEKQNCSYLNWQEELSRSPTLAMIFVPDSVMYKSLKQNNKGFGSAPNYGPNWSVPQGQERNTRTKMGRVQKPSPRPIYFSVQGAFGLNV
jgi:hypothetical protein